MMKYLVNLLILLDNAVNALFAGDPSETISSRLGRRLENGQCRFCSLLCCFLSLFDRKHWFSADHCVDQWQQSKGYRMGSRDLFVRLRNER